MIRLFKWLYELGATNERQKIHRELLMFIGQKPERTVNTELNYQEDKDTYLGRLKAWHYAQKMIADYFESWDK